MLFSSRHYAVGLAHYQITGGNRGLALLIGSYLAVASVVFGLVLYNVNSVDIPRAMVGISTFLLVIQAFGLIVFGSGRIASCIRADTASNMMESHRLMPVDAWRVVLSYMFGTTSQLLIVLALNAVVMVITENIAHIPFESFVISQVALFFFAFFVWSFLAMCAFMFRQALPLMVFGLVFGSISGAFMRTVGILPALAILGSPFLYETIFNLSSGRVNPRGLYAVALPAQLGFGLLFFIGACRRYRGSFLSTFNVGMGIALVVLWGLLSWFSIWIWPRAMGEFIDFQRQINQPGQIIAALVVAALLCVVPTHALAAWESARGLTHIKRTAALVATILAASLPLLAVPEIRATWMSTLVIALHVVTLYSVLRFTRGTTPLVSGVLVISYLIALWIIPLFLEMIRWILFPPLEGTYSILSTFSPLGLLISAWRTAENGPTPPPPLFGFLLQSGVAAAAWQLGRRRLRRLAAQAAAETQSPASGLALPPVAAS